MSLPVGPNSVLEPLSDYVPALFLTHNSFTAIVDVASCGDDVAYRLEDLQLVQNIKILDELDHILHVSQNRRCKRELYWGKSKTHSESVVLQLRYIGIAHVEVGYV